MGVPTWHPRGGGPGAGGGRISSAHGESRLVDNIVRIEQLLTRTMADPVSSEERVLHQGAFFLELNLLNFLVLCVLLGSGPIGLVKSILIIGWVKLSPFTDKWSPRFRHASEGEAGSVPLPDVQLTLVAAENSDLL